MVTFKDILKKSFLEGWTSYDQIGAKDIIMALALAGLISLYIFAVYRTVSKNGFYSKTFNISLFGIAMITTAIIITIQTNVVVSLGMVGALSIVRFRTAVKDPMDLMFLFWAIGVGIMCGAGHAEIAVILSVAMTAGVFGLNAVPEAKASTILVVVASDIHMESKVTKAVDKFCNHYKIKARNLRSDRLELTYEVRTKDGGNLVQEISAMQNISSVSMIAHDGEITF